MFNKISDFFYRNLKKNPKKKFLFVENKSFTYKESLKKINLFLKIFKNIRCKNIICITKSKFTFFNILISASELNLAFSPLSSSIKSLFFHNIINQNKFDCLIIDKNIYKNFDLETKIKYRKKYKTYF